MSIECLFRALGSSHKIFHIRNEQASPNASILAKDMLLGLSPNPPIRLRKDQYMGNLVRSVQLNFRVTPEEKEMILENMKITAILKQ